MDDVRLIGDLKRLQSARFDYVTVDVVKAPERLQRSGLIPTTCLLGSVRAVFDELRADICKGRTNQELLKHLLLLKDQRMKPHLETVVRVWLLSSTEFGRDYCERCEGSVWHASPTCSYKRGHGTRDPMEWP